MTLATKIYRDHFVHNINTPLCDEHAEAVVHSHYSYIEAYEGNEVCSHCEHAVRDLALNENRIFWSLIVDNKTVFSSGDRKTFWDFVKASKLKDYKIDEKY